ncbi:MAG: DUF2058 family protein [Proteobacteria bacterium]|nr:DUF2058 family protein [Pseudomonadota bacterium]
MNTELRSRLIAGDLAIARCEGRYAFVPVAVGQRIRERVERAPIHWNDPARKPGCGRSYSKDLRRPRAIWSSGNAPAN